MRNETSLLTFSIIHIIGVNYQRATIGRIFTTEQYIRSYKYNWQFRNNAVIVIWSEWDKLATPERRLWMAWHFFLKKACLSHSGHCQTWYRITVAFHVLRRWFYYSSVPVHSSCPHAFQNLIWFSVLWLVHTCKFFITRPGVLVANEEMQDRCLFCYLLTNLPLI